MREKLLGQQPEELAKEARDLKAQIKLLQERIANMAKRLDETEARLAEWKTIINAVK